LVLNNKDNRKKATTAAEILTIIKNQGPPPCPPVKTTPLTQDLIKEAKDGFDPFVVTL